MKTFILMLSLLSVSVAPAAKKIHAQVRQIEVPFAGSVMFAPSDGKPHPGVLLLHGSGGGTDSTMKFRALELAGQGYVALAYCYFDCRKSDFMPAEPMENVEVRKIYEAMLWLKKSPFVQGKKVGLFGRSKGAELALVMAAQTASDSSLVQPDAVAAHAPSDKYTDGWMTDWNNPRCWSCKAGSGKCSDSQRKEWMDQFGAGETIRDLAAMDSKVFEWNPLCGKSAKETSPLASWMWDGKHYDLETRIPVEKYKKKIFLTVGTADMAWSPDQTRRIEKSLRESGLAPDVHYFEGEGHSLGIKAGEQAKDFLLKYLAETL